MNTATDEVPASLTFSQAPPGRWTGWRNRRTQSASAWLAASLIGMFLVGANPFRAAAQDISTTVAPNINGSDNYVDIQNNSGGNWYFFTSPTPSTATMSRISSLTEWLWPSYGNFAPDPGVYSQDRIYPGEYLRVYPKTLGAGTLIQIPYSASPLGTQYNVNVTVTGGTLNYQWYRGTSAAPSSAVGIPGATGSSYVPPAVFLTGTYQYFCRVSTSAANHSDSATSYQIVQNFSFVPLPTLTVTPGFAKSVTLAWPGSVIGFVPQFNSSLSSTNWASLETTVRQTNDRYEVTAPTATGAEFYRLELP